MTISYPHTQNYAFVIQAHSYMFQSEDSDEASIKNFLKVSKIQLSNAATAPDSSQFCISQITLLLETSLTLILSPVC